MRTLKLMIAYLLFIPVIPCYVGGTLLTWIYERYARWVKSI